MRVVIPLCVHDIIFYVVPRPGACLLDERKITLRELGARTSLVGARMMDDFAMGVSLWVALCRVGRVDEF